MILSAQKAWRQLQGLSQQVLTSAAPCTCRLLPKLLCSSTVEAATPAKPLRLKTAGLGNSWCQEMEEGAGAHWWPCSNDVFCLWPYRQGVWEQTKHGFLAGSMAP
jgi:hypothetical protein